MNKRVGRNFSKTEYYVIFVNREPSAKSICSLFLGLLVWVGLGAGGCTFSTSKSDMYSTHYLGSDGRIYSIPSAPFRGAVPAGTSPSAYPPGIEFWWEDDPAAGPPSIVINLTEQRAYFKRGNKTVGMTTISSGREGYSTPTGNFRIIQKSREHVSNLYGDYVDANGNVVVENVGVHRDPRPPGTRFRGAPMPYFLRIHGAVGMHAGYLPGYPASHGCIRLPMEMAKLFFENSHVGMPVIVTQ